MAHIEMTFYSEALGSSTDITVIIPTPYGIDPEEANGDYFKEGIKYPVLYLLHGTWADHHDWMRWTSIERYAQKAKLMVVCMEGANSFYQDMEIGPKYFTYITEELPRYLRILFPVSDKREDTYIAGLSMGGCGALNLALRKPEMFGATACLSGGLIHKVLKGLLDGTNAPWPWKAILPPPYDGVGTGIDEAPILEELVRSGKPIPRIYLAVGLDDFVYESTQETREVLDQMGVAYTYEEGPGIHDWVFWDEYIQHAIKWFNVRKPNV